MAQTPPTKLPAWDRFWFRVAPRWSFNRMVARQAAEKFRHFEAASRGRRTQGWTRQGGDANSVNGPALADLRIHARDLTRNCGWAKKGLRIIVNSTVGTGIVPKPIEVGARSLKKARELWRKWSRSTNCDFDGRRTFYGLQRLVMRRMAEDGEVLIRKYPRPEGLQIRILEADLLDTAKDTLSGTTSLQRDRSAGFVIQGVEFDGAGRRVAYWLFDEHPGASSSTTTVKSRRIPVEEILHVFDAERAGQVRGVSWFAAAILPLKDFDEYEDATAMKQKIAALFTAFVTNAGSVGAPVLGEVSSTDPKIETLEPGQVLRLDPGQDIKFSDPPAASDHESFSRTTLRKAAAGLSVTYEALTGDYSGVNYSSARMGRIEFQATVDEWRWDIMIPLFCDPVWGWFMDNERLALRLTELPAAEWTCPPLPAIDPDKEALATMRRVRMGQISPDEMVREQGGDPETHWEEVENNQKMFKAKGIILDCDPSVTTQAGNPREQAQGSTDPAESEKPPTDV